MTLVNTNILRHPLNWLIIWSMILIAGFVFHLLYSYALGKHPGAVGASAAGPGTSANTTNPTATS